MKPLPPWEWPGADELPEKAKRLLFGRDYEQLVKNKMIKKPSEYTEAAINKIIGHGRNKCDVSPAEKRVQPWHQASDSEESTHPDADPSSAVYEDELKIASPAAEWLQTQDEPAEVSFVATVPPSDPEEPKATVLDNKVSSEPELDNKVSSEPEEQNAAVAPCDRPELASSEPVLEPEEPKATMPAVVPATVPAVENKAVMRHKAYMEQIVRTTSLVLDRSRWL